jgi:hypothetical protein
LPHAGDTRGCRERQYGRQEQREHDADDNTGRADANKPPILPIAVSRADNVPDEVPANTLQVGCLTFELLKGGANQPLAAVLERASIALGALIDRLAGLVELLKGSFDALANDNHFAAHIARHFLGGSGRRLKGAARSLAPF